MTNQTPKTHQPLSIILPCKNEAQGLPAVLHALKDQYTNAQILVVDDGSTDSSGDVAERAGAQVIRHPYAMGNGAAIKSGLRAATGDVVVCMDADGQHRPEDVAVLLDALGDDYDMAVGARSRAAQASTGRRWANAFYNWFAGLMVGHKVPDLTSGMRAFRREKAREFLHLLPNGFSYPTTLTMAFFRAGYPVKYAPIQAQPRIGKSHLSLFKDGVRFLLIIFKVGTLYAPLKLFFPASFGLFVLGIGYYLFTYFTEDRFTNMGALLLLTSVVLFLMGLVSEQITTLMYRPTNNR